MSDLEKACQFLKTSDGQTVISVVGPVVRVEKADNVLEIAREQIGGIDWSVIRFNGERIYQS